MPSTPISGPISFSNIIDLAKDYPGYIPPANIGLQALALHVRTYGQAFPPNYPNNIAFSDFRLSTIVNWSVSSTNETSSTYGTNNNGTISVTLNLPTFKANTVGLRNIELSIPGKTIQTINASSSELTRTVTFTGFNGPQTYTVSVKDLITNVTTTKTITVGYG